MCNQRIITIQRASSIVFGSYCLVGYMTCYISGVGKFINIYHSKLMVYFLFESVLVVLIAHQFLGHFFPFLILMVFL